MLAALGHGSEAQASLLTAAHPDDWRAWALLADSLPPGEERLAAGRRACELTAKHPSPRRISEACRRGRVPSTTSK
jgi:hypothetical protein